MSRVTFVEANGHEHVVDVADGISLMEAALSNSVPGIDGDCGGNAACATCHVYVDPEWSALTGTQNQMEHDMLEFAEGVEAGSRLGCQIHMSAALDGLVVRMPAAQH
jgi:ferredoxin, 2Fe-2S